jgi:hypothetical protein
MLFRSTSYYYNQPLSELIANSQPFSALLLVQPFEFHCACSLLFLTSSYAHYCSLRTGLEAVKDYFLLSVYSYKYSDAYNTIKPSRYMSA